MKTRPLLIAMLLLLGPASSAQAQVSFDIGFSNGNIGFNIGNYPQLALIPGSPVYYAPRLNSNFFFYDGLYWVYRDDRWFSSIWYNGPWEFVGPQYVPLFVLRVPVRYYRQPPQYFRGWRADAPPRWGQHWGRDWERERSGWNNWNRRSVPPAAPLPTYQRQYQGNDYPRALEQQHSIRAENYRYQPRENLSREYEPQRHRPDNARPDYQREAPEVRQPQRQQTAPSQPQQTAPAPRGNPPDRANDAPQRSYGQNDRQRENLSREPEPQRGRPDNPRPDQQRHAPEVQQQTRPQMAPNPPQPPPSAQQRLGPPAEAREAPQRSHGQNDKSEDKGKENRGNEQGRDRH
jgi:hypothetical protein